MTLALASLVAVLAAAVVPGSAAFAAGTGDAPDALGVEAIAAEACEDCVDPDADENLVDDSLAAVEMHPTSDDEANSAVEVFPPPSDRSQDEGDDGDGDRDSPASPAHDPLRAHVDADDALGVGAPLSLPLPQLSAAPRAGSLARAFDPPTPPPDVVSGLIAAPALSTTVVWLRTRSSGAASDDDLAAHS